MTFGQLNTFLALARAGSVRGGAAARVVTEPAVSAAVGALQRDLGVELVTRQGRGIMLTPAGDTLARYAAEVLGLRDQEGRGIREGRGRGLPGGRAPASGRGHDGRRVRGAAAAEGVHGGPSERGRVAGGRQPRRGVRGAGGAGGGPCGRGGAPRP